MKIINLTPHTVNDIDSHNKFAPSGTVARVDVSRQCTLITEDGVKFYVPSFGDVVNLPEEQEGVALIVSAMVRTALPNRRDLISPSLLARNEAGEVIGCYGFDSNFVLI